MRILELDTRISDRIAQGFTHIGVQEGLWREIDICKSTRTEAKTGLAKLKQRRKNINGNATHNGGLEEKNDEH